MNKNFFNKYYNKFKMMNPRNTELKLIVIIALLVFLLFRGITNFTFSWDIVIFIFVFVMSMTLHEIAHGYIAYRFGDDTAKREGRITLNPLKHIDMTGLLLPILLILSGSSFLVGWAKPVPVNFARLRPNRLGLFCVAIAGIVVNIIIATICGIILRTFPQEQILISLFGEGKMIINILLFAYKINIVLALFNLIPITPLDGGRIVYSLANYKVRAIYEKIEPYGIFIVFLIVYIGIFSKVLSIVLRFFLMLIGLDVSIEL